MRYLLSNAHVFRNGRFKRSDLLIEDGRIVDISERITGCGPAQFFDFRNCYIFPGLTDVHVHLREPGFSYKETIASGTAAAARGGFTSVCSMPNLDPVPDSEENLAVQLALLERDSIVNVYPYGAITMGEKGEQLADIEKLAGHVVGFSDDGKGVQNGDNMLAAMRLVQQKGSIIAAHCEDERFLSGGYIHDGDYARRHGHQGISSKSEWRQLERDIGLAARTYCRYHVCHVSTKESVALIRQAKKEGLDISCETAPHYLTLCDADLQEDGRFKMNPPLRAKEDRDALLEGIQDGTIDIIATDHAPHSAEEKSKGLRDSAMGVVGLETAFAVLYTRLVKTGVITLERLLALLSVNPNKRFRIGTSIETGGRADITVFDLEGKYRIDANEFASKGKSTPFEGWDVFGRCILTMCDGRIVWNIAEK